MKVRIGRASTAVCPIDANADTAIISSLGDLVRFIQAHGPIMISDWSQVQEYNHDTREFSMITPDPDTLYVTIYDSYIE